MDCINEVIISLKLVISNGVLDVCGFSICITPHAEHLHKIYARKIKDYSKSILSLEEFVKNSSSNQIANDGEIVGRVVAHIVHNIATHKYSKSSEELPCHRDHTAHVGANLVSNNVHREAIDNRPSHVH